MIARNNRPVIIVGGGPAGMMAGLLFARAGVQTVVLEKHRDFLRDFRGDTVHPSTLDIFSELGLLDALLAREHDKVEVIGAVIGGQEYRIADFKRLPGRARFIAMMPQWHFLDFVAEQARLFPAFSLRMQTEVVGLIEGAERVEGVRLASGEMLEGALVIAADGRGSILRKAAGLPQKDLGAPIDVLGAVSRMVTCLRLARLGKPGNLSGHEILPLRQRGGAAFLVCLSINEVAFGVEVIVQAGVNGSEFLQRLHLPEPQHRPLPSSERKVGILSPVVQPAANLLLRPIADVIHSRPVGAQPIGDDRLRRTVTLQRLLHKPQRRWLVARFSHVAFENFALVIDRTPQVMRLAVDLHVDLIEIPFPMAETAHSAHTLPPNIGRKHRAKTIPPQPHRLVADVNAAFEQQILHVPKRQRETHIHQHDKADHLGRRVKSTKWARRLGSRFAAHSPLVSWLAARCPIRLTTPA